MNERPPEASRSLGWQETAEAMHVNPEPKPKDLNNKGLHAWVANLSAEIYLIAKRAFVRDSEEVATE